MTTSTRTLRLVASSLLVLSLGEAPRAWGVEADEGDVRGAPIPSTIERVGASAHRRAGSYAVAFGAMYGHTEAVLGQGDSHQRTGGSLLIEATPLPWMTLGLRLDGRYDKHTLGDGTTDDGWVGEPRAYVQVDRALARSVSGGLRAVLWLPGRNAPSIVPGASTVDLAGVLTFAATRDLRFTALGGYRVDGSAKSVDDAGVLGPGDRQALMVSDFNAVLAGVGAQLRQGAFDLNASWSADVLVGAGAPAASTSPMRLGVGARGWVARAFALEVAGEVLTSKRPGEMPMPGHLVPVPPRYAVLFGAVATFGGAQPRPPEIAPLPVVEEAPASICGRLALPGRRPRGLTVSLLRGENKERAIDVGEDGGFAVTGVKAGRVTILVEAPGWKTSRHELDLRPGLPTSLKAGLERSGPSGQIRGVVRSFTGKAVVATVRIAPRKSGEAPQTLRSEDGAFSAATEPGQYDVIIEASGYEPQRRSVSVEEDGVTVLNVDLRRGAR